MDIGFLLVVLLTPVGALLVVLWARTSLRDRASASNDIFGLSHSLETVPKGLKLYGFRNVIVPDERGTTEIDVVFVGNAGIFVIELKDFNAWIFGDENEEK
jgi:hypothetical protein